MLKIRGPLNSLFVMISLETKITRKKLYPELQRLNHFLKSLNIKSESND